MNTTAPEQPAEKRDLKKSAQFFAENVMSKQNMFYYALGCTIVAIISLFYGLSVERDKNRYVAFDNQGNYFLSLANTLEKAEELHFMQTKYAVLARFSLNPNGLDFKQTAERLYSDKALITLKREVSETSEVFKINQIHQKPEIFEMQVLKTSGDYVLVETSGQLLQQGRNGDEPFENAIKFKARFTFKRNPDWLKKSTTPTIVWDYRIKLL